MIIPIKKILIRSSNFIMTIIIVTLMINMAGMVQDLNTQPIFYLEEIKEPAPDYGLKGSFLQQLIDFFGVQIFVETGTYAGDTAFKAATFFKEIHTIELDQKLFDRACERFRDNPKIKVYLGDSGDILPQVISTLEGKKILFWLDGHYSEGDTAKGKTNTPILQELEAIKNSGIQNAIILIDDMRCFKRIPPSPSSESLVGYPTINQLHQAIKAINEDYQFEILGDTAIAYPASTNVRVSPVVHALTVCHTFEDEVDDLNFNDVLKAENIIANATGVERKTVQKLHTLFKFSETYNRVGKLYRFLYALTLMQEKKIPGAFREFVKARELGYDSVRVQRYLNECEQRRRMN